MFISSLARGLPQRLGLCRVGMCGCFLAGREPRRSRALHLPASDSPLPSSASSLPTCDVLILSVVSCPQQRLPCGDGWAAIASSPCTWAAGSAPCLPWSCPSDLLVWGHLLYAQILEAGRPLFKFRHSFFSHWRHPWLRARASDCVFSRQNRGCVVQSRRTSETILCKPSSSPNVQTPPPLCHVVN